jgi:hypothetical protein
MVDFARYGTYHTNIKTFLGMISSSLSCSPGNREFIDSPVFATSEMKSAKPYHGRIASHQDAGVSTCKVSA